jgi:hypothetical protein
MASVYPIEDDLLAYNAYPTGMSSANASVLGADSGFLGSGGFYDESQKQQLHQQQAAQQQQQLLQQAQAQQQQQQQQAQLQALAMMAQQQQQQGGVSSVTARASAPAADALAAQQQDSGYLEQMWQRRRDVAKLCLLSLVVLLAISTHTTVWHYLLEYIETATKLTYWREVALRAAYPVVVLLVLWNVKGTLLRG